MPILSGTFDRPTYKEVANADLVGSDLITPSLHHLITFFPQLPRKPRNRECEHCEQ
jgi:hypothetical protein